MQNVAPGSRDTPGAVRRVGPALGEHNDEVYRGLLGLDADDGLAAPDCVVRARDDLHHRSTGGPMTYRLGVDVGGTFTDILLIDEADGRTLGPRRPSTPRGPVGRRAARHRARLRRAGVTRPRSATSCTAPQWRRTPCSTARAPGSGSSRPRVTARCCRSPVPSCPAASPAGSCSPSPSRWRRWRTPSRSVERIAADGSVVKPLDEAATRARWSSSRQGIEALTVCLINSFTNAEHERRVCERRARSCPGCRCPSPRR